MAITSSTFIWKVHGYRLVLCQLKMRLTQPASTGCQPWYGTSFRLLSLFLSHLNSSKLACKNVWDHTNNCLTFSSLSRPSSYYSPRSQCWKQTSSSLPELKSLTCSLRLSSLLFLISNLSLPPVGILPFLPLSSPSFILTLIHLS